MAAWSRSVTPQVLARRAARRRSDGSGARRSPWSLRELLDRHAAQLGDTARGVDDVRGLASLPPEGHGREVRAVRLDEDAVDAAPTRRRRASACALLKVTMPENERSKPRSRARAAKARSSLKQWMMPPTSRAPSLSRMASVSCGGLARVHDDGLPHLARQADEAREDVALRLPRGVVVVVVEADLADGDDLGRAAASAASSACAASVQRDGVVRVDADRRDDVGGRRRHARARRRRARRLEVAADADDDEARRRPAAAARAMTAVRRLGEVARRGGSARRTSIGPVA